MANEQGVYRWNWRYGGERVRGRGREVKGGEWEREGAAFREGDRGLSVQVQRSR